MCVAAPGLAGSAISLLNERKGSMVEMTSPTAEGAVTIQSLVRGVWGRGRAARRAAPPAGRPRHGAAAAALP